ncbi:MAG: thioredoxin family protein [Luteolibacter sp.]
MTLELTETNFQSEVLDSTLPVLVDFWGEHCGPCKRIAPLLDQLAGEMAGIAKIGKVDVGSQMPIAVRYGIRSVPNLLFLKNGEVKDQFIGAEITKEQIRAKLEALV